VHSYLANLHLEDPSELSHVALP